MPVDLAELQNYLYAHIPLTVHLDASIKEYNGQSLTYSAPLRPNTNQHNSVFGGSLAAVAVLSGWTLAHIKLSELKLANDLVIQSSQLDYLHPVTADFEVVSRLADDGSFDKFSRLFERKGRGRLTVETQLMCGGEVCGLHQGVYVAVKV